MNHLSDYLVKLKKTLFRGQEVRDGVMLVLKEVLGVDVLSKDIEVKGVNVRISSHPTVKNEIKIKKDQIISKINTIVGVGVVRDIF